MCLGIPGQVVRIDDAENMLGTVDVSGVRRQVNLACVGLEAIVGQWVLVHVGFAMSRIDAAEAAATLTALEELGEAMEEIEAIRASNAMLQEAAP
jgi:hydrogenase expression/formation protein HypC